MTFQGLFHPRTGVWRYTAKSGAFCVRCFGALGVADGELKPEIAWPPQMLPWRRGENVTFFVNPTCQSPSKPHDMWARQGSSGARMAEKSVFDEEAARQRRGLLFSRLQTGFTALLALFFMGVSAWSINSILNEDRPPGIPPAQKAPAEQAAPVQQAPAPKKAEPPQQQRQSNDDWIVNAPN